MKFNLNIPINTASYGLVGFNILKELLNRGYLVSLWPISGMQAPVEYHEVIKQCINNCQFYDCNAPSLRIWHQFNLAEHVGRVRVGWPIFELDRFNNCELNHLSQLDKLIVCSEWAKNVCLQNGISGTIAGDTGVERFGPTIHVVPLGVDRSIFHESVQPAKNFGSTTVFANFGKWEYRKGHDVIVQCFNEAFTQQDDVALIMHCRNWLINDQKNEEWADLYKNSPLGNKIFVSYSRAETQQEVAQLMASAHCGIFPARAEGWNLEILEMMAMGKQIITTNYSGHTAFCTSENAHLIEPQTMEDAIDGEFFKGGYGSWLEITDDMKQEIIYKMREVHNNLYKKRVNEAGIDTSKKFSWANAVDRLLEVYDA